MDTMIVIGALMIFVLFASVFGMAVNFIGWRGALVVHLVTGAIVLWVWTALNLIFA